MSTIATETLRVRVKDRHIRLLRPMARGVNAVWNYCNRANRDTWRKHRWHLTGFDLNTLCKGSSAAFDYIGNSTIQEVGQQYASKPNTAGRARLKWRVSNRKQRSYSLGRVPFRSRSATFRDGINRFAGYAFRVGCFAEDTCGHWYFCI